MSNEIPSEFITSLGSSYYNLACYLSLQEKKQEALDAFAEAIKYEWHNYSHAKVDTDLDFIRDEDKFKELMHGIRDRGDFMYILRNSGEYIRNKDNCKLNFTYHNSSDSNLMRVSLYMMMSIFGKSLSYICIYQRLKTYLNKLKPINF